MSKVFKSIAKKSKRAAKLLKVVAIAAAIFTAGAALGVWGAGVSPGAGMWANVKSAWTGLGKGVAGIFKGGGGTSTQTAGASSAGEAGASAAAEGSASIATEPILGAGQQAITLPADLGGGNAIVQWPTGLAAPAGEGMTAGQGILAATGLNVAGQFIAGKEAEKAAEVERDRYNRETFSYGVNRYGQRDPNYQRMDWSQVNAAPRVTGAGLASPTAPGAASGAPSAPPATLDELIQRRNTRTV